MVPISTRPACTRTLRSRGEALSKTPRKGSDIYTVATLGLLGLGHAVGGGAGRLLASRGLLGGCGGGLAAGILGHGRLVVARLGARRARAGAQEDRGRGDLDALRHQVVPVRGECVGARSHGCSQDMAGPRCGIRARSEADGATQEEYKVPGSSVTAHSQIGTHTHTHAVPARSRGVLSRPHPPCGQPYLRAIELSALYPSPAQHHAPPVELGRATANDQPADGPSYGGHALMTGRCGQSLPGHGLHGPSVAPRSPGKTARCVTISSPACWVGSNGCLWPARRRRRRL